MIREDAKDNILEYYNVFRDLDWQIQDMLREGVDSRIDEIYDYFEQRIAELEAPKTCSSCKHRSDYDGEFTCKHLDSIVSTPPQEPYGIYIQDADTLCCINYEPKDK